MNYKTDKINPRFCGGEATPLAKLEADARVLPAAKRLKCLRADAAIRAGRAVDVGHRAILRRQHAGRRRLATGCRMIFILEVSQYRLALRFNCKQDNS
jgi:hypothetical protein